MTVLVWQWGRHGAGPRFAAALADSLAALPGMRVALSLSEQAEILHGPDPPRCDLPFATYDGMAGLAGRVLTAPALVGTLAARLRRLRLRAAVCAMPAPLDLLMATALRRIGVPYTVVVHDAEPHHGGGPPLEMALQRRLAGGAAALVALTRHVGDRLSTQGVTRGKTLLLGNHPPFVFGPRPLPPRAHGGPFRLLCFGRLRPYKGLDLLAEALRRLGPRLDLAVRVVGQGSESEALRQLRTLSGVTVENRWVPESDVAGLLAWADALVLTYREASQSGVAAAALAAGRWVVATRVGGLAEQLDGEALGVLCEPDAASIAAALRRCLDSPAAPAASPGDSAAAWRRLAETLRPVLEPP